MSSNQSNNNFPTTSPKLQRINIIEQKLNLISQSKVKSIKDNAYDNLQKKVIETQKRINQTLRDIQSKVREYKETFKDLDRKYIENKSRFQLTGRVRKEQIVELQRKINQFIMTQHQARRESEHRLLFNFQEKFQQLSLQLAKQIDKRKIYFNHLDMNLTNTLPSINTEGKIQIQEWKVKFEQLDQKLIQQLENIKQQIRNESKKREKSYQHLMEMMNEVISEIKKDLTHEKMAREENRAKMLKLFEGTCQKLLQ